MGEIMVASMNRVLLRKNVPKGWKMLSLNTLGKITTGSTPSTKESDNYGDDYVWVSPADMGNSKYNSKYIGNSITKLSKKGFDKTRRLKKGSILVTCIGSTIGKTGIASVTLSTNQQINSITPHSIYSSEYIYYSISYFFNYYRGFISNQAVPIMNKNSFSKIRIPIPPLAEQKKIVDILTIWDVCMEKTESLINEKKILKKGLMQKLLTGKIRFKEFENKEWKLFRLGDISYIGIGNTFPLEYQNDKDGYMLFIKVSDMNTKENNKYISNSNNYVTNEFIEKNNPHIFEKNTIVFAKVGVALLLNKRRITTKETIIDNNMIGITPHNDFMTEYLYQLLLRIDFGRFVQSGAVPSVNKNVVKNIKVKMSIDKDEIIKISSVLSLLDNDIKLLNDKLSEFRNQKRGLIQKLLTGRIKVLV